MRSTQNNSIIETLTFFDVQDLPLTALEIVSYAKHSTTLRQTLEELQGDLKDRVETDGVFFCLRGRSELFVTRRERYQISFLRMRKAKKVLYWLRHLPFVRAVAISGSQAILNSRAESDIDLFIVTAKNRIWLARFLVTVFLQLLGVRRHGKKTKNRFCLNHYIAENTEITRDKNLYTAVLYSNLLPVFGRKEFERFYSKNRWIEEFISSPQVEKVSSYFDFKKSGLQKAVEFVFEATLTAVLLNRIARSYQKSRIVEQDHVHVSENELSFHPESKGQQILAKFGEKSHRISSQQSVTVISISSV